MNILQNLFGRRHRKSPRQFCIIDASGFIEKKFGDAGGQTSPKDNFYILKVLSQFTQREELETAAVFTGRPLREAGEGARFKGVTVYYVSDDKNLPGKIRNLVRACPSGKEPVVVTDNHDVEMEAMRARAQCMRISTLKKGMERHVEPERPRRPPPAKPAAENEPAAEEADSQATEEKQEKEVFDLIDPV